MYEEKELTAMFQAHRDHLRAVAYRMLGSLSEADDAVQETWLRLERTDVRDVANMGGWLTTVVGRVCLNLLRSRRTRGEEPLEPSMPDPVVTAPEGVDPEHEALLSDSVGLALLVVLQTLEPAERLAFVLHDMFAVPFDEIAPIVDRTPAATRQLASRARRRVRDGAVTPDPDLARQREVVDAFMAASRAGDFDALVAVLDPDVVLRADAGGAPRTWLEVRGALEVAGRAFMFRRFAAYVRPVLVNGVAGVVTAPEGRPLSVMAFTVAGGRVVALDILSDEDRLAALLGA
ncbi:sigma-70 family RNA polymerase sigma factor [Nonomuraea wenchangensis]|uniref:RNA polymerase sigma-70 factor, ECF subfamily n=1 Tax=Nonomuraea wenchangensis TaxID=568860 RepID=A0A1I0DDF4_9ACTN|nr:sigma-70 family RNA polymerase sigma factor [Nonomuraea wenchangensis]SET30343.1 RNA polymerase sigma-70 factor, ECF subfamily [Nonomuraea wenchangensis]